MQGGGPGADGYHKARITVLYNPSQRLKVAVTPLLMHRMGTKDPRASALVVHGGRVYTSGQVGDIDKVKYHAAPLLHSRELNEKSHFSSPRLK